MPGEGRCTAADPPNWHIEAVTGIPPVAASMRQVGAGRASRPDHHREATMARNTQNTQNTPDLAAELEALKAALAEAQAEAEQARQEAEAAKASRKPRERRMTPKQRKLVEYLREHPEADIATACEAAGATATSHGFVFRMIEHGYLKVTPVEAEAVPAEEPEDEVEGEQPEGEAAPAESESEAAPAA